MVNVKPDKKNLCIDTPYTPSVNMREAHVYMYICMYTYIFRKTAYPRPSGDTTYCPRQRWDRALIAAAAPACGTHFAIPNPQRSPEGRLPHTPALATWYRQFLRTCRLAVLSISADAVCSANNCGASYGVNSCKYGMGIWTSGSPHSSALLLACGRCTYTDDAPPTQEATLRAVSRRVGRFHGMTRLNGTSWNKCPITPVVNVPSLAVLTAPSCGECPPPPPPPPPSGAAKHGTVDSKVSLEGLARAVRGKAWEFCHSFLIFSDLSSALEAPALLMP